MPGVLKRAEDYHTNPGNDHAPVDVTAGRMAGEGLKKGQAEGVINGDVHVNGTRPLRNGQYANGIDQDMVLSPQGLTAVVEKISEQLPPEIEHLTTGYLPLSKLITRLTQDTFNGLTEVINELEEMQVPQPNNSNPYLNGVGTNQATQVTVEKKTRMWDFAQDRRAKFIKILVLSQWSRQAEAVSRVIDLNLWIDKQKNLYNEATAWIGELKRILASVKVPSPDLKTALEALSTGKASWLPDLGYVPPEPLSSQRLLKALRTINALLSIRLNLHETIPPPFRGFTIASGRATFHVPDEFELDISIADEDISSQLYFIDFRFLFSPCLTEVPAGRLRGEIEGKTNDILKNDGLAGCYVFLRNLVLTHKLSILRHQAFDIARGRWSENIRVEVVHRSIVIHYWMNKPGGKSWIEIGIKHGKRKESLVSSSLHADPYIALRWHRYGKEVRGAEIGLDLGDLSMEKILKHVIALHTSFILHQTKHKLQEGSIYSKRMLALKRRASAAEPADCSLEVQLTSSQTVKIVQEPISGAFALLPTSGLYSRVERDLNSLREPAVELASRITNLRCIAAQDEIEAFAKLIGWEPLKTISPDPETVARLFSRIVVRIGFFKIKSWGSVWMLASTTSMSGDSWWVVESYRPEATEPMPKNSPELRAAFRIPVRGLEFSVIEPSYSTLFRVETTAAAIVSQYVDTRHLARMQIAHRQQEPATLSTPIQTSGLYIHFSPRHVPPILRTPSPSSQAWCHEIVEVLFKGLNSARTSTYHIIRAQLLNPIPNVQSLTTTIESSISFHPTSGVLAFRLSTPVGISIIPAVFDRLKRIERLIRFLGVIEQYNLQCETLSLSRLVFTYAKTPQELRADISFATDAPMRMSLELGNPHLRIRDFLTGLLNSNTGLENVTRVLRITLPLLRAFSTLESNHTQDNLQILARSATWYRVRYERPQAVFDVNLRQRRDGVMWYLQDLTEKVNVGRRNQRLVEGMSGLWQERGEGWKGMKAGIIAEVEGVEKLVEKIDEIVREAGSEGVGQDGGGDHIGRHRGRDNDAAERERELGLVEKRGKAEGKEVVILD